MIKSKKLDKMYIKSDTLTTRIGLHDKYSVNKYGFGNWVFDQYIFKEGYRILELGCGTAVMWQNKYGRIPNNSKIILSDFSPLMVQKAKDLLHNNPAFSFEQINIEEIPYDDQSFDIVIANHMLYHVPDLNKALSEVSRVLKTHGIFYATTLGEMSLKELNDIYAKLDDIPDAKNISFTLENGLDFLKKYFEKVELRHYIDALEVTNIEDLIEYIKSYNDIPAAIDDELYRLVSEGFVDGVFKIQKEQGIFICS